MAADQAPSQRHVDREAHCPALLGLRLGPVRGPSAQPARHGPATAPPVNVLPTSQGRLQNV